MEIVLVVLGLEIVLVVLGLEIVLVLLDDELVDDELVDDLLRFEYMYIPTMIPTTTIIPIIIGKIGIPLSLGGGGGFISVEV